MLYLPFRQAFTGLVLFFTLALPAASAASFGVSPVIAHITEQQRVTSFTIQNQSPDATTIELRLFRWQQVNGVEKLSPAPELLVTPTIFKLPGNASQIIRVGMRKPVLQEKEQAYRLILEEIPSPPKPGFQGLNMLLKISIPIFASKSPVSPDLNWRGTVDDRGKLMLDIDNTGMGHTRILQVNIEGGGQQGPFTIKRQAYLLAGDHQRWLTDLDVKPGMELELVAQTSKGQENTILKVE